MYFRTHISHDSTNLGREAPHGIIILVMESTFTFVKHELSVEQGTANFYFNLQTKDKLYQFKEVITFPTHGIKNQEVRIKEILDALLLILGISYWKTFCPKTILTPTIQLTKEQANFWNTTYTK